MLGAERIELAIITDFGAMPRIIFDVPTCAMIPVCFTEGMGLAKSISDDKCFKEETAAYAWVEARVWPQGPICPHCGGVESISKMRGKSTRLSVYKCYQCRKPFTVKVGTVLESSHVPMHLWLQAMFLLCSSKNGISSNRLHQTLGVTLKTAWFISHRIREAMRVVGFPDPMGGADKIVETDRKLVANDSKQEFERAFAKIVPPKKRFQP